MAAFVAALAREIDLNRILVDLKLRCCAASGWGRPPWRHCHCICKKWEKKTCESFFHPLARCHQFCHAVIENKFAFHFITTKHLFSYLPFHALPSHFVPFTLFCICVYLCILQCVCCISAISNISIGQMKLFQTNEQKMLWKCYLIEYKYYVTLNIDNNNTYHTIR